MLSILQYSKLLDKKIYLFPSILCSSLAAWGKMLAKMNISVMLLLKGLDEDLKRWQTTRSQRILRVMKPCAGERAEQNPTQSCGAIDVRPAVFYHPFAQERRAYGRKHSF